MKILFIADTHLGYDLPLRPRIDRRRRGHDFFQNYQNALEPAFKGEVDAVLHGGDLFFRSRVHPNIVSDAFEPLLQIADNGIPVYIVQGNHERSQIPRSLFETHENIFIFDTPSTYTQHFENLKISFSGFPCVRNGIQGRFKEMVKRTQWQQYEANVRFLCMHQAVEGAQVGVQNYTFRFGADIIRGSDIPPIFDAVLSGHIHRAQVLPQNLGGVKLGAPVIYPGATERTSFAERGEAKGYFIIEVILNTDSHRPVVTWNFYTLPTRDMHVIDLNVETLSTDHVSEKLKHALLQYKPDSIVRFRVNGKISPEVFSVLSNKNLRRLAPPTMNVEFSIPKFYSSNAGTE